MHICETRSLVTTNDILITVAGFLSHHYYRSMNYSGSTKSSSPTDTPPSGHTAACASPTEYIRTPSKITSHNGKRYPPCNRPHNATFGRPRGPFLLVIGLSLCLSRETQRRTFSSSTEWEINRASAQLHRTPQQGRRKILRHPKLQGPGLRPTFSSTTEWESNPQNPPRLHFPNKRPRSFPLIYTSYLADFH